MNHGYVQVYTGEGKGKTTAALGLALRAAGAGFHVYIGQFCKAQHCSEHLALKRFDDLITIRQFGEPGFIFGQPSDTDKQAATKALTELTNTIKAGNHHVVILEEINIAIHIGLIDVHHVLEIIRNRPPQVELVLTGRYAHPRIIEAADLVTEMRPIKHYMDQGVQARTGIEK